MVNGKENKDRPKAVKAGKIGYTGNGSNGAKPMLYRHDILVKLAEAHGYTRYKIIQMIEEMVDNGEMSRDEAISMTTVESIFKGESCNVVSLWAMSKLFRVPMIRLFDFKDVLLEQDQEKAS